MNPVDGARTESASRWWWVAGVLLALIASLYVAGYLLLWSIGLPARSLISPSWRLKP